MFLCFCAYCIQTYSKKTALLVVVPDIYRGEATRFLSKFPNINLYKYRREIFATFRDKRRPIPPLTIDRRYFLCVSLHRAELGIEHVRYALLFRAVENHF